MVDELAGLRARSREIAAMVEQLEPAPEIVRAPARKETIDVRALNDLVHTDCADNFVVTLLELEWPGLRAAKARPAVLDYRISLVHRYYLLSPSVPRPSFNSLQVHSKFLLPLQFVASLSARKFSSPLSKTQMPNHNSLNPFELSPF